MYVLHSRILNVLKPLNLIVSCKYSLRHAKQNSLKAHTKNDFILSKNGSSRMTGILARVPKIAK